MHCLSCGNVASEETNDKTGTAVTKKPLNPTPTKRLVLAY